jgi:hypothetical protein
MQTFTSTQKRLIAQIQSLHNQSKPLNISYIRRHQPKLIKAVYTVRPYWGWRQALKDAGIDYRRIDVQLEDTVECRLCRKPFGKLAAHLHFIHGTSVADYLHDYPDAETQSETVKAASTFRSVQTGSTAVRLFPHWEPFWSPEYVLDRIHEIHRRGLPVHEVAIHKKETSLAIHAVKYFGSWDATLRKVGLDPMKVRINVPNDLWTPELVVKELRSLYEGGQNMQRKALEANGHRPLCHAGVRCFGSHEKALQAASVNYDEFRYITPKGYSQQDREKLQEAIRGVACIDNPIKRDKAVQKLRSNYDKMVTTLYGNECWGHAARDAGLPVDALKPLRGKYPTPEHVVQGIRRRKRENRPLNYAAVVRADGDTQLLRKGVQYFGSWDQALLKAGVGARK